MSAWVRSSQIVRNRSAQNWPVVGSGEGQAATLAVVNLSKTAAPFELKPTLTTHDVLF